MQRPEGAQAAMRWLRARECRHLLVLRRAERKHHLGEVVRLRKQRALRTLDRQVVGGDDHLHGGRSQGAAQRPSQPSEAGILRLMALVSNANDS